MQQVRVRGEAILTAIDESVIVLLKGLGPIPFSLEGEGGDAFGTATCVVMKGDVPEWSHRLGEQFL